MNKRRTLPRRETFGRFESLESRCMLAGPDGSGFTTELVVAGLNLPVAFDIAPDDRWFVTEKAGRVKIVENGKVVGTFIDLASEVESTGDKGLIGIALDPDFDTNGHVYLNYTVKKDDPQCNPPAGLPFTVTACGQLLRVTASANDPSVADLTSRLVIQDGHIMSSETHSVGDVDFDVDDNLIFSWGDGGFDNSLRLASQDPDSVQGKVFRIDRVTFDGVPANPFYETANPSSTRSRVWSIGNRNSWRMSVDQPTGDVYIGEVTDRGPEEVNVIRSDGSTDPLNFGWPYFEDDVQTGYAQPPIGFEFERALVAYAHTNLPGGDAIVGGNVYRGTAYPSEYEGRYFFGNLNQGTLYTADQTGSYQQFGSFGQYPFPVDIQLHDDHIYLMSIVNGDIQRLVYDGVGGPPEPTAVATVSMTAGVGPLTVQFDGTQSLNPGGGSLTYEWDFESDGVIDSTLPSPSYSYTEPGRSLATLRVANPAEGTFDLDVVEIDVLDNLSYPNLALGSSVTQSTTASNGFASRAVDGDIRSQFNNLSVSQTDPGFKPLWEVDLGAVKNIGSVRLFTRTDDGPGDPLQDYWVLVSDVPFSSANLAAVLTDPGVSSYQQMGVADVREQIEINRTGRYVRVQLDGLDNILSLAEVEVFEQGQVIPDPLGFVDKGINAQDSAAGTGFVLYSEETIHTRFINNPTLNSNSDHLIPVKYLGGQWVYDNNTAYIPFSPRSTDLLIAELDFSADTITDLAGIDGAEFGIAKGYQSGDLTFVPNVYNGVSNGGEFTIDGTFFIRNGSEVETVTVNPGAVNKGIAVDDGATGTGYVLHSRESLATRFAAHPPLAGNSDQLIAVRYLAGGWQYSDNFQWFDFSVATDDRLIAELDFSARTISPLQGTTGQVFGIDQGYVDGDLSFQANLWNGSPNYGEYFVGGTYYTIAAGTGQTYQIGALNKGIGVQDRADGSGYLMYSAPSVHTRFAAIPPLAGNSDHLIAVRYVGGVWQYNTNAAWIDFVPEAEDRLLASIDYSSDTIISLQGASGDLSGIEQGYVDGDLTFSANVWNGKPNNGEFSVAGSYFSTGGTPGETIAIGDLNSGVAADDQATGNGYLIYSAAVVHSRFAANPPLPNNSDHVIAVRYEGGQWQYNTNSVWVDFTPVATDRLLASIDFDNDTISSLQGQSGDVGGIDQGYASGDLTFFADMWNGKSNNGEFQVLGTFFTV